MFQNSSIKISTEDLKRVVRSIVNIDNLSDLTEGKVRKKLAEHFKTSKEYMDNRSEEVSAVIKEHLKNLTTKKEHTSDHESKNNSTSHSTVKKNDEETVDTEDVVAQLKRQLENDDDFLKILEESPVKEEKTVKVEKKVKLETKVKAEPRELAEVSEDSSRRASTYQQDIMTKDFFLRNAGSLELKLRESNPIFANPRTFSTGSCGWYCNTKMRVKVADTELVCQVGFTCTVVGSKNWTD